MRVRWFGRPWPDEDVRAGICDDDAYKVETPVGQPCLYCPETIREHDRGVLMASAPGYPAYRVYLKNPEEGTLHAFFVVACHIDCLVRATVGEELAKRFAPRRDGRRLSELPE